MSLPHPLSDSELVTASRRRDSANSVPFPSPKTEKQTAVTGSESSSSDLTSSDKLSALPAIQSSPALGAHRTSLGGIRRSPDAGGSLPSLESSPGMAHLSHFPIIVSRASESEGSHGKETPRQRVSFDSDRGALPAAVQNLRQAVMNRISRGETAAVPSSSARSADTSGSQPILRPNATPRGREDTHTPASRSPTQSRAASPLRFFGWNLHRAHSRDEPFIPTDPFKLRIRFTTSPTSTPRRSALSVQDVGCQDVCQTCLPLPVCTPHRSHKLRVCGSGLHLFFVDILPRQVYLHVLLRLPALYFSRVSRIFEDAEVSKHEIQRMIEACMPATNTKDGASGVTISAGLASAAAGLSNPPPAGRHGASVLPLPEDWNPPSVSPALARFKNSWEQFVDSLLREWKTLNLVSVLLFTAILTLFQLPDAAGDPITRWTALFSLVFSIMSLTYGCIYIVQFGTMRTMYKASRWAEEAQKTKTGFFWNIWVLLAMPAIWLAWSMVAFCIAILSFIWRTGASDNPSDGTYEPLSPHAALAVRTVLTVIFALGLVYFVFILRTFSTYGERETDWRRSWLATGHPSRTRDPRRDDERERGRQRQRQRGREGDHDNKQASPAIGLGLLGVSRSGSSGVNGLASMTSVLLDESFGERNEKKSASVEVLVAETGRGRSNMSPSKIAPKL